MLEEKIKAIQVNIENCGEEGLVDEAQEYMRQVDTLTSQLNSLRSLEAREKKMEVCGICAALLVVNDAPERIAAHMSGKQHNGYQKIRETFEQLRVRASLLCDNNYNALEQKTGFY